MGKVSQWFDYRDHPEIPALRRSGLVHRGGLSSDRSCSVKLTLSIKAMPEKNTEPTTRILYGPENEQDVYSE
jgi:hypothetical protein